MPKPIKHITVACYTHPELYPPVLSALQELSPLTTGIDVITRRMLESHWGYPDNVKLHYVNKTNYKGFGIEALPLYKKLWHFITFVQQLRRTVLKQQSDILIVHDVIPLFAAYLLQHTLRRHKIALWYHNHDVTDLSKAGKFSIMGIAARFEAKAFKTLYIFSLPARERLTYFPSSSLRTAPIVIPNYPLKRFYDVKVTHRELTGTIKMVFQGSIGAGHGLEALIEILNSPINDKRLELHMVGKVLSPYLKTLQELATSFNVSKHLYYHGMQPFAELPEFLAGFDVGLAIHEPYNVTYATGGSASNKIYEYAACGLPVLLLDNPHYRGYLGHLRWAYFTQISSEALRAAITKMDLEFGNAALAARADFEVQFNYELHFKKQLLPVLREHFFNQ